MKLATAVGAPIVVTVGDREVTFNRLTMGDMAALGEKLHKLQQAESAGSLKTLLAAGVKQDQLPMIVRELERRPSYPEVRRWAFTTDGALAVLVRSTGKSDEEVRGWADSMDAYELALELIGIAAERTEGSGEIPLSESGTQKETG